MDAAEVCFVDLCGHVPFLDLRHPASSLYSQLHGAQVCAVFLPDTLLYLALRQVL